MISPECRLLANTQAHKPRPRGQRKHFLGRGLIASHIFFTGYSRFPHRETLYANTILTREQRSKIGGRESRIAFQVLRSSILYPQSFPFPRLCARKTHGANVEPRAGHHLELG